MALSARFYVAFYHGAKWSCPAGSRALFRFDQLFAKDAPAGVGDILPIVELEGGNRQAGIVDAVYHPIMVNIPPKENSSAKLLSSDVTGCLCKAPILHMYRDLHIQVIYSGTLLAFNRKC